MAVIAKSISAAAEAGRGSSMRERPSGKSAPGEARFEMLATTELEPHPEALMPIDEEDKAAIRRSIQETGILAPLLVAEDRRSILDGVNRWQFARELGIASVPCVIRGDLDPRQVAMEMLSARRKASTGQRVLLFLEAHWKEVKKSYLAARARRTEKLKRGPFSPSLLRESDGADPWESRAIAERLHCCQQDILAGMQFLLALEEGKTLPGVEPQVEADDEYKAAMQGARTKILCGGLPIRRANAAVGGMMAGRKYHGRANSDYSMIYNRAVRSMHNSFQHWGEIEGIAKDGGLVLWRRAIQIMPPDLKAQLLKMLR